MAGFDITGFIRTVGIQHLQDLEAGLDKLNAKLEASNRIERIRNLQFQKQISPMIQLRKEAELRALYTDSQVRAVAREQVQIEGLNAQYERKLIIQKAVLEIAKAEGLTTSSKLVQEKALAQVMAQEAQQRTTVNIITEQRVRLLDEEAIRMQALEQKMASGIAMTDAEIQKMAQKRFNLDTINRANEHKLAVEMELLRLKQQSLPVDDARLRQMAQENVQLQENEQFMQARRRMLFQTAFAIFAVTINIQFMMQSIIGLAGADKEAAKSLKDMQRAFTLLIGPIQLMLGLVQLMTIKNEILKASIIGVMKSASVILPLIIALTTASDNLRRIMLGVATAFGVVNAILVVYTMRMTGAALATIFKTQADIIQKAVMYMGATLPIIAGAIAGGLLLFDMLPKRQGQTQVGFGRRITETHQGEMILGRPSEPQPLGGDTGPMNVNIYLDGQKITDAIIETQSINRAAGVY